MAKDSGIEWTTHTFNPWWGCVRVSPACKHCYADTFSTRLGMKLWGPGSERRFFDDVHWKQPLAWNRAAIRAGIRHRVFCASMADVFEDRRDLDKHRERLWRLIEVTPGLDWLLLTKRPQLVAGMVPWGEHWPANVWIGTTVEDQARAEERLSALAALPAVVRFISAEPLLGHLELGPWMTSLDWVIAGGESGGYSRPSSPSWMRDLLDQCLEARIPFFFKQWGDWSPWVFPAPKLGRTMRLDDASIMQRAGVKVAGRVLVEREWNEVPVPRLLPNQAPESQHPSETALY